MDETIICIPKVGRNINKKLIYDTFERCDIGKIKRIDLINTNYTKRAFIHYESWNTNEQAIQVKNWLIEGKDIKIIYNKPWYWKCSAFKKTGH